MPLIRPPEPRDTSAIADIYNHYVTSTIVTFEEEQVSSNEIARRIDAVAAAALPWFVADEAGRVLGYAYATPWKSRSAYRFAVEVTIYVESQSAARGLGTALYERLFDALRDTPIHVALAGIALPNDASIALHEKFGMRKVAHFNEVGFKLGRWIDVAYWQRLL